MSADDPEVFYVQSNTPLGDEVVEAGACDEPTVVLETGYLRALQTRCRVTPPPKPSTVHTRPTVPNLRLTELLQLDEPLLGERG